jgi:hypothetical protein
MGSGQSRSAPFRGTLSIDAPAVRSLFIRPTLEPSVHELGTPSEPRLLLVALDAVSKRKAMRGNAVRDSFLPSGILAIENSAGYAAVRLSSATRARPSYLQKVRYFGRNRAE